MYWHYAKWQRAGTWEAINTALRERQRVAIGRAAQPTAAIIDSQSVRSTEAGGPDAGRASPLSPPEDEQGTGVRLVLDAGLLQSWMLRGLVQQDVGPLSPPAEPTRRAA